MTVNNGTKIDVRHQPCKAVQVDLLQFAITQNAFLPEESMPERLSDSSYEPWELLCDTLAQRIKYGTIRDDIAKLPILSTDRLTSEAEWRRAYVMLAYLASANTWGGDKPLDTLPPQIAVPLLCAAGHVEMPPGVSYAATNLWNFKCTKKHDFSNIEDLDVLVSFTGTKDEVWFLMLSIVMETKAADIIQTMLGAIAATYGEDYCTITSALKELRYCIETAGAIMMRMYEGCDPRVFYHQIRPFLAGSKNMEHAGLPNGIFFDEGNGKGEWRQLRGGSNGQSSLIQFFDIVLGVEHKTDGSAGKQSFHHEVREYMPGPHRRFLEYLERASSIRHAVRDSPESETELRAAYVACAEALSHFRDKHIQIVTRYIILPSKQAQPVTDNSRQNLASASSKNSGDQELTGTGGTTLVPFLKEARDETIKASHLK